jgi:hypothetical protein
MTDGQYRQNAIIESTLLGWEDHGIFTFTLRFNYGTGGQSGGNLCLSYSPRDLDHELFSPIAMPLIAQVMKTVGVREWEQIKGKHIVVLTDKPYGMVVGIAPFLGDGRDLIFKDAAETLQARAEDDFAHQMKDLARA